MPPCPPLRQVHLDFHTPGLISPVAPQFDAEAFAQTMRDAHVLSVNVFARCHHGYSYYPTKVGTRHPGLAFDLLGRQIEALHAADIKAIVYVTIGWDDLAGERHPEWIVVGKDGRMDAREPLCAPSIIGGLNEGDDPMAARWTMLDPSTGYGDYVCDQIRELCRDYEIDGFWFDICLPVPNYSPWGRARMREAGVDVSDDAAVAAFARERELAYLDRVSSLVRELAPHAEMFFNGTTDAAMGQTVGFQTHLDIESLATSPGLWGYLHYPMTARQARVYGLPFLGMTGRFHKSWADFGGLKTFDQLDYEVATILAAGGGAFVGDQLHPSGVLDAAVYRLIGRVFERVERLEPWLLDAVSDGVADVAIVSDPRLESFGGHPAIVQNPEVEGAAQMFLETGIQFDIVDPGADLGRYRLVVLPDGIALAPELRAAIRSHLERGGRLLASGTATLGSVGGFDLEALPVEYVAPAPTMPGYFRPDERLVAKAAEAPGATGDLAADYDYVLYDRATVVRPKAGAEAFGSLSASLFDRTHEHFFSHAQSPVGEGLVADAPVPLVVAGGGVAYLAAPFFRAYRNHDYWPYRDIVLAAVHRLLSDPIVRFDGPPWIEVSVLRQAAVPRSSDATPRPARSIVHLVAYHPRRTVQSVPHVDRSWATSSVRVSVRTKARPRRCYLAPDEAELPFTFEGGYATVEIPSVGTHAVLVIE